METRSPPASPGNWAHNCKMDYLQSNEYLRNTLQRIVIVAINNKLLISQKPLDQNVQELITIGKD